MIGCRMEGRKSRLLCIENVSSLKVYLSCQKSQILTYKLLFVFYGVRRVINLNFSTQAFGKMQGMRHRVTALFTVTLNSISRSSGNHMYKHKLSSSCWHSLCNNSNSSYGFHVARSHSSLKIQKTLQTTITALKCTYTTDFKRVSLWIKINFWPSRELNNGWYKKNSVMLSQSKQFPIHSHTALETHRYYRDRCFRNYLDPLLS